MDKPSHVARIGGDEFAVLMPATGLEEGQAAMAHIETLVELNNQFYSGSALVLSMGLATGQQGERLEDVVRRADLLMYENKRAYYSATEVDRRRPNAVVRP